MATERPKLHPAEHRAYRELYAVSQHLIHRWARLGTLLEKIPVGESLQRGAAQAQRLIEELKPRTEAFGLYGSPMAQGLGAGLADLRTGITDRGADTGLVVRFAVLDAEHVTTLLRQLAELARARDDHDLAGFCEEWAHHVEVEVGGVRAPGRAVEPGDVVARAEEPELLGPPEAESQLDAVRQAAIELGSDPDRVAAPVVDSVVNRAAHGLGWTFGAVGEGIDRLAGLRRRR